MYEVVQSQPGRKGDLWLVQAVDMTSDAVCDDVVGGTIGTFRIESATTRTPESPGEEAWLRGRLALMAGDGRVTANVILYVIARILIISLTVFCLLGERWKSACCIGSRGLRSLSIGNSVGNWVDGLVHANLGRQELGLC